MSSQPASSLAQAGSGHWRCPLHEERERFGRGGEEREGRVYIQRLSLS